MEEKELIINNKTKLLTLKNRKSYTKITLGELIFMFNILRGFDNVKELTLDHGFELYRDYNEERINKLPFISQLKKISYKNIKKIGYDNKKRRFPLNAPNLESIELPSCISKINPNYFIITQNLKEIIFYFDDTFQDNSFDDGPLDISKTSLKRIILKSPYKNYPIELVDYKPTSIDKLYMYNNKLFILYSNNITDTKVTINNNEVHINNCLKYITNDLMKDKCLYIPDYITSINETASTINPNDVNKIITKLSLNLKLLSSQESKHKTNLKNMIDLNFLKNIVIRNDKEMALFPNKEYDIEKYGSLEDLYIKNNKLNIIFKDKKVEIDQFGKECILPRIRDTHHIIDNKKEVINDNLNINPTLKELTYLINFVETKVFPDFRENILLIINRCIRCDIEFEYTKCLQFLEYCTKDLPTTKFTIELLFTACVLMKDNKDVYELLDSILCNKPTSDIKEATHINECLEYMLISKQYKSDNEKWKNNIINFSNNKLNLEEALINDNIPIDEISNLEIIRLFCSISNCNIDKYKFKNIKINTNNFDLNKLTLTQLDYYNAYKKILKLLYSKDDITTNNALDTIEKALIKKINDMKGE